MTEAASIDASYENVAARCPSCGKRNIYNRVTDIGSTQAIDHHMVVCENRDCRSEFAINGDVINPAHECLLLDARAFLEEKRYCQAVLSATTAYEVVFSHFFRVELVYRPSRRDRTTRRDDLKWLNESAEMLQRKLEKFTFQPLRTLFLRFALDVGKVSTIDDARHRIGALQKPRKNVLREEIERVKDEKLRKILLRVHEATIADLRNKIVHKSAYRPRKEEAVSAVDEAWTTVFSIGQHYKLKSDDLHLNERPDC